MKKRMKLLVITLHFWLNRLCGINNDKSDKEYNNTNARRNNKCNIRSNII